MHTRNQCDRLRTGVESPVMRILIAIALCCVVVEARQSAGASEFDVVSIKRSLDTSPRAGIRVTPGRFTMENRPVSALVDFAFRGQITGGIKGYPDWAINDRYNVVATTGGQHGATELAAMMRAVLVERFKFVMHTVTEEQDGLALVRVDPDRVPAGLRKIDVDCADPAQELAARNASARMTSPNDAMPPCYTLMGTSMQTGGQAMSQLAQLFGALLEKNVVDDTGLDGFYAFTLSAAELYRSTNSELPTLSTAVREQLGLRLVARRLPVTVLVIDHIERPSEN